MPPVSVVLAADKDRYIDGLIQYRDGDLDDQRAPGPSGRHRRGSDRRDRAKQVPTAVAVDQLVDAIARGKRQGCSTSSPNSKQGHRVRNRLVAEKLSYVKGWTDAPT